MMCCCSIGIGVLVECLGGMYIFLFFFFFQAEDGIRDVDVTGVQTCAFFFQAEDGIRGLTVTGVQTCALPILAKARDAGKIRHAGYSGDNAAAAYAAALPDVAVIETSVNRSEERRVGKECRSWWWPRH